MLTRALGTGRRPEPDLWILPAAPEDRFLVCTDGLTRDVPAARIAELLSREPDARRAAAALVAEALLNGGHDNVSVVVVDGGTRATTAGGAGEAGSAPVEPGDRLPRQRDDGRADVTPTSPGRTPTGRHG